MSLYCKVAAYIKIINHNVDTEKSFQTGTICSEINVVYEKLLFTISGVLLAALKFTVSHRTDLIRIHKAVQDNILLYNVI